MRFTDFDGQIAGEVLVAGPIDFSHTTGADLLDNLGMPQLSADDKSCTNKRVAFGKNPPLHCKLILGHGITVKTKTPDSRCRYTFWDGETSWIEPKVKRFSKLFPSAVMPLKSTVVRIRRDPFHFGEPHFAIGTDGSGPVGLHAVFWSDGQKSPLASEIKNCIQES